MNHAALNLVNSRLESGAYAREYGGGQWWCRCCSQVTEPNIDGETAKCVICGSPRLRWDAAGVRSAECGARNDPLPAPVAMVKCEVRVHGRVVQPFPGRTASAPAESVGRYFDLMRQVVEHAAG